MSRARDLGNGQFQFSLIGTPGSNYEVQVSSDLALWEPLRRVLLMGNTTNILAAKTNHQQFYKARLVH